MSMERMLINARNPEEMRVAIEKDGRLDVLNIQHPGQEQRKGDIYLGKITHCEKSLNAIFVQYCDDGKTRDGFLPKNEILPSYFTNADHKPFEQLTVDDIREGQQIIVQVDKEERGTKGAALTTYISLAGCYLVLMPNNPRAGGISRRIEGEDRNELRELLSQLHLPENAGVIIRTAGVGKNVEELQWDLDVLLKLWDGIVESSRNQTPPLLIHQESDAIGRAVRDYLRQGISEILVDSKEAWEKVRHYVTQLKPDFVHQVKLYEDFIPLFNRYRIESQIEAAFARQIKLPSGGNIVIDHTEALISIDVNSARATRGGDIEETAFHTNIEAAKEIARQLRIRDLPGIIVIDFIDMSSLSNQREVENVLREEVKQDRARIQIGRISRFGILEMSRQRLRPSLREASSVVCPRCQGHGRIRAIESLALAILRLLQEEAMNKKTAHIEAQLPLSVASYLLNEKRADVYEIEEAYQVSILLIPNEYLETPHYQLKSFSKEELKERGLQASYRLAERPARDYEEEPHSLAVTANEPALKSIALNLPVPPRNKSGLLKRVWETLFRDSSSDDVAHSSATTSFARSHTNRIVQYGHTEQHAASDTTSPRPRQNESNPNQRQQRNRVSQQNQDRRQGQRKQHQRRDNRTRMGSSYTQGERRPDSVTTAQAKVDLVQPVANQPRQETLVQQELPLTIPQITPLPIIQDIQVSTIQTTPHVETWTNEPVPNVVINTEAPVTLTTPISPSSGEEELQVQVQQHRVNNKRNRRYLRGHHGQRRRKGSPPRNATGANENEQPATFHEDE